MRKMEDAVLYAVKDNIATITLNRPQSLNSMNDALIDGLHDVLDRIEKDDSVRCIVLTGNGKVSVLLRQEENLLLKSVQWLNASLL